MTFLTSNLLKTTKLPFSPQEGCSTSNKASLFDDFENPPTEIFDIIFKYCLTPFRDPINGKVLKEVVRIDRGALGIKAKNLDEYFKYWEKYKIKSIDRSIFINEMTVNFLFGLNEHKYNCRFNFFKKIRKSGEYKIIEIIKNKNEKEMKSFILKTPNKLRIINSKCGNIFHYKEDYVDIPTIVLPYQVFKEFSDFSSCTSISLKFKKRKYLNEITFPFLPNCAKIKIQGADIRTLFDRQHFTHVPYRHKYLRLLSNKTVKKIPINSCLNCTHFTLKDTHFTTIELPSLPNCRTLCIENNYLETIQFPPSLRWCHTFHLKNNHLKKIQLPSLLHCRSINLLGNRLQSITSRTLPYCASFAFDHYSLLFCKEFPHLPICNEITIKDLPTEPLTFKAFMQKLYQKVPHVEKVVFDYPFLNNMPKQIVKQLENSPVTFEEKDISTLFDLE